jgi:hypothetical protein
MTFIESLTTGSVFREDFFEILKFKYPALFVEIAPNLRISDLIKNSISYLGDQL